MTMVQWGSCRGAAFALAMLVLGAGPGAGQTLGAA
jgi:hypothetical protein